MTTGNGTIETAGNGAPATGVLDWMTIEDGDITSDARRIGSQFPVLSWLTGTAGLSGPLGEGGFFMDKDSVVDGVYPEGFEPTTRTTSDGDEIQGAVTSQLDIILVGFRRRWQVETDDGGYRRFPWGQYNEAAAVGAPRGKLHLLVLLEDLSSPVLLSFSGLSAKAMTDAIAEFERVLVKGARLRASQMFPRSFFRMRVGPTEARVTVGSGKNTSSVHLPTWLDAGSESGLKGMISRAFVGKDALASVQSHDPEVNLWVQEWRRPSAPPAPDGDNATPQGVGLGF